MSGLIIALGIVYVVVALAIIVAVICQDSDNSYGLGAMAGNDFGAYSSMGKNKAKNALLLKVTIACAIVLVILTVVLNIIIA